MRDSDLAKQQTTTVRVNVCDKAIDKQYPYADAAVVRPEHSGTAEAVGSARTEAADAEDAETNTPNADAIEEIDLGDADGEAELPDRSWVFKMEQNGRVIRRRTYRVRGRFNRDHIPLPLEPYTVDVRVTGGPDREPIPGATVEATVDDDIWRAYVASTSGTKGSGLTPKERPDSRFPDRR